MLLVVECALIYCANDTIITLQEPSENGPLFCELKFYQRAARPDLSKLAISPHVTPPRPCLHCSVHLNEAETETSLIK